MEWQLRPLWRWCCFPGAVVLSLKQGPDLEEGGSQLILMFLLLLLLFFFNVYLFLRETETECE